MELNWVKSSHSLKQWDPQCITAATLPDGGIAIRDSKNPDGAMLRIPRATAMAFIHAVGTNDLAK